MKVEFQKTGQRRYAIGILRDGLPKLEMNPAPGFDELMPHDMLHFLVEQEFGLRNAIFGQVATGGTSGTFMQAPSESKNSKQDSRQRRKLNQKGRKMMKDASDEYAQSERATYICWYDWLSHSSDEKLRSQAKEMKITADSIYQQMSDAERKRFSTEKLAQIRKRMDELSQKWVSLRVNESLTIDWQE